MSLPGLFGYAHEQNYSLRFESGSYTGTGTYGKTIRFNTVIPKLFFLNFGELVNYNAGKMYFSINGGLPAFYYGGNRSQNCTYSGRTITITEFEHPSGSSFNKSSLPYYYFAVG